LSNNGENNMRGILINPCNRTITEVTVQAGLDGLYSQMQNDPAFSGTVELVKLSPIADLWIDEEGNLSGGRPVWHLIGASGEPHPFAGAALILGNDGEGDSAPLHRGVTLEVVKKLAHWSDLVTTGDFTAPSEDTGPDGEFIIMTGKPRHISRDEYEAAHA
jgi:hypothetical protein